MTQSPFGVVRSAFALIEKISFGMRAPNATVPEIIHACICARRALDKIEQRYVPDGWVAVPRKPTYEMETSIQDPEDCATPDAARRVYDAMIAASPAINDIKEEK